MKKLLFAAGFVLAATTAAMAQGYAYSAPYGAGSYYSPGYGSGLYDYAPGYGYGGNWDYDRSDGPGRGNSAESQR
jgi:hypothetical protein